MALLGANGAGKTTTLLTIGGFLRPMSGEVTVLGQPVLGGKAHEVARRGLAHVPEGRSVFFGMTVADNLRVGVRARHRSEQMTAVEAVLEYFPELREMLRRRAGDLSGGEQQMLALGRAFATLPSVLIVDELSLGLAPIVVERLVGALQAIARERQVAVLFVEQHIHVALEMAERIYVLERGQLAAEGSASKFREQKDFLESSYLGHVS